MAAWLPRRDNGIARVNPFKPPVKKGRLHRLATDAAKAAIS
jgi:hypothetical protein